MKKLNYVLVVLLMSLFVFSCDKEDNVVAPVGSDRDKFIGNWAGTYDNCDLPSMQDTMYIVKDEGELDVLVTLMAQSYNATQIHGVLTEPNIITLDDTYIDELKISGIIEYSNNSLSLETILSVGVLSQSCYGTDYIKY